MTTSLERLAAALAGEALDRVPVFCNLIDQGAQEMGLSPREYFSSGDLVAEAQLRQRARLGYDNVWSLFYVGKEAELWGCRRIIFPEQGSPNVGHMVLSSPRDIEKLETPPDLRSHPVMAEPLRCLEILRREVGGKVPICAYVTASFSLPALLMGMEQWIEFLLTGPASLRDELLAKCADFVARHIQLYRDAGADVILYSNPYGSTDIIPARIFDQLALPWMDADLRSGGVQGIVYYCGGARMNPVISTVLERTGIQAYYPSPLEDLAQTLQILDGRALCAGVINDIRLITWSGDEVRAEVKRIMRTGAAARKFLFGPVVMPAAVPAENIRVMLDTAYEYGKRNE